MTARVDRAINIADLGRLADRALPSPVRNYLQGATIFRKEIERDMILMGNTTVAAITRDDITHYSEFSRTLGVSGVTA